MICKVKRSLFHVQNVKLDRIFAGNLKYASVPLYWHLSSVGYIKLKIH